MFRNSAHNMDTAGSYISHNIEHSNNVIVNPLPLLLDRAATLPLFLFSLFVYE